MHGPSSAAPKIDKKKLSIFAVELLARLNETIEATEKPYRDSRVQHRRATALRFYLERLLRLVRRSGEDRNLQRRRIEEKIRAGGDGLRLVRNARFVASVHAAQHRGALVAARSREGIDSICAASGPSWTGG